MRCNEVKRNFVVIVEGDKLRNPTSLTRRRTSNWDLTVNGLDCQSSPVVQGEILSLRPSPKPTIWLVPNLKFPTSYFIETIPIDQVGHKRLDQVSPVRVVFGWGYVALVMENRGRTRGQLVWHETQFHNGLHADFNDEVVQSIDIEKFVLSANNHRHIIVKDSVKSHVLDPEFFADSEEMLLPVLSESQRGMS